MKSAELCAWRCRIVAAMRAHGCTLADCRDVLRLRGKEDARRYEAKARRRQLLPLQT